MKFSIFQESRIGKRKNNEDRIGYCYSRDALLMVVADGMGGHTYGEIASQVAVQYMTALFQKEAQPSLADPFLFLQRGMIGAHHAILDFCIENQLDDSPRTTCVACVIQNNVAYWSHVGDSRLYHFRGMRLFAKTRDHSRVRQMVDQGMITEEEAAVHPDRNKVYTCLGGPILPEIEFSRKSPLESNDVLLLSTDGFWGPLPVEVILPRLREPSLGDVIPVLMDEAELRAGPHGDNLSLIAVRWGDSYVEPVTAVSTHTMGLMEVTTKTGAGRTPASTSPLPRVTARAQGHVKADITADEIDRAISEIKDSIDRVSR